MAAEPPSSVRQPQRQPQDDVAGPAAGRSRPRHHGTYVGTTASAAHVRGQESNARRSISPTLFARAVGFKLHSFDVVAHSSGRGSHGRGTGCEAPWTAPAIAQNGSRLSRYRDDLVNRDIHSGRWNCYTRSVKTTKIVTYPFFTAVYVPARFASASPTNIGVPDGRGGDWPVTRGPLTTSTTNSITKGSYRINPIEIGCGSNSTHS